ncbi:hypothetical protein BDV98DRAFT_560378 [Pterulicium gracile]|uniref:Translational machinery component n=1 Tax=Pterulicium gracile TaxID=1884261 RepID=A0A5C3QWB4_9AGAR|nr:hypothetical protein BDV98DRAFT_560378 [Pterula gracilis]
MLAHLARRHFSLSASSSRVTTPAKCLALKFSTTSSAAASPPPLPASSEDLFSEVDPRALLDLPPSAAPGKHTAQGPASTFVNPITTAEADAATFSKSAYSNMISSRPLFRLHIQSSRNNTLVTFTSPSASGGKALGWASGGRSGFKGTNKSSFEAAYQAVMEIFKVIRWRIDLIDEKQKGKGGGEGGDKYPERGKDMLIEVVFKGAGKGREAMSSALSSTEGAGIREKVIRMTDRTPIKVGGTRAQKARRL